MTSGSVGVKNREKLMQIGRGFCMGCADVIPGVSGGTLALILGIYARLIESIKLMDLVALRAVFTGQFWNRLWGSLLKEAPPSDDPIDQRVDAVVFVGFLVTGILAAIVAAAGIITYCRTNYPEQTRGFFLGLVLASLQVPFRHIKHKGVPQFAIFAVFAVGLYLLLGMGGVSPTPALWYVFIAGSIAICAMILPGISGAFILLMLGMYDYIMEQVKLLVYQQQFEAAVPIIVLCLGIAVGIITFSRVLNYLLNRHHDMTMAALLGLMAGSLRVLWPFKEAPLGEAVRVEFLANRLPDGGESALVGSIVTFVVGVAVVMCLDLVGRKFGDKPS